MVPHSRGCHSGDRRWLSPPPSLAFLSPPAGREDEERGSASPICTPSRPSVDAPPLSRSPPLNFSDGPGELTARVFAGTHVWAQFHASEFQKPARESGCGPSPLPFPCCFISKARSRRGGQPFSSSPPFSQGLFLASKLAFYKQKSCWHERTTKSHHLKPLFRSRRFSALKERGFLFWL